MKKCYTCQQMLDKSLFNKNKCRKDGLNSICRECSKTRSKQYYKENPIKHKLNVNQRNKKLKEHTRRFIYKLKSRGCIICDEKSPCCIDFHHLNPSIKEANIANLCRGWITMETIKKELRKCVRVCSNCHRKLHAGLIKLEPLGVEPK